MRLVDRNVKSFTMNIFVRYEKHHEVASATNESTENPPENHRYAERYVCMPVVVCVCVCGFVWVRVYECVSVLVCVGIEISRRSLVPAYLFA